MAASMCETLTALGYGIVKVMISAFVGTGVGLITFGASTQNKPEVWQSSNPPGEMFLSFGVGMFITGVVMALAFVVPRLFKRQAVAKPVAVEEWTS